MIKPLRTIDILSSPPPDLLRKQIQNIRDSYSHSWDILAELLQNSVDAIRRYEKVYGPSKREHEIRIAVNSTERSIDVSDTGTGFQIDKMGTLLAPHGTDKKTGSGEIGSKGVGLTFAIFSCDRFYLDTKSTEGRIVGSVENALTWVQRGIGPLPCFTVEESQDEHCAPEETYSRVLLEKVERDSSNHWDLFASNTNQLAHIIRTYTAVGNCSVIFGEEDVEPKVSLEHVDLNGSKHTESLPFRYALPTESISSRDQLRLAEFILKAAHMDDRQKARELQGKTLFEINKVHRSGRDIRYFACFVPSRATWDEITSKISPTIGQSKDDENGDENIAVVNPGIYVATKGMPTGICLIPPKTGGAGYWPNTYILLEDNSLEFDLGRKSIPGRTQSMLKEISKEIFNDFLGFVKFTWGVSEGRSSPNVVYAQQKLRVFNELDKLPNLGVAEINFMKNPDKQEAGVVAIFHELVGKGILKGYYGLRQSYRSTYDCWGKYRINSERLGARVRKEVDGPVDVPIVIEFKHDAQAIIPDANENKKFFEDIDLLVCWDLDEREFAKEKIQVQPIHPEDMFYYGSNYRLEWPGAHNLGMHGVKDVLALRKFIEDYNRGLIPGDE